MTIHLTPDQERRVKAVIGHGAYESVEEVVEAALAAVEQRAVPGFAGTQEELDALLVEGLVSKELTEEEFWDSVSKQAGAMLSEHKLGPHSRRFRTGKLPATMLLRQFRHYLVTLNLPEVESLRRHPFVGPRYHRAMGMPSVDARRCPRQGLENLDFRMFLMYYLNVYIIVEESRPCRE